MESVPLVEAIGALREQLGQAMREGEEKARLEGEENVLRSRLENVELELQLEVSKEVDAGIRFWLVSARGAGSRASTHTVRLTLAPEGPGGITPRVARGGADAPGVTRD